MHKIVIILVAVGLASCQDLDPVAIAEILTNFPDECALPPLHFPSDCGLTFGDPQPCSIPDEICAFFVDDSQPIPLPAQTCVPVDPECVELILGELGGGGGAEPDGNGEQPAPDGATDAPDGEGEQPDGGDGGNGTDTATQAADSGPRDWHTHCCKWALGGECENNAVFMLPVCQKSCGSPGCTPTRNPSTRKPKYIKIKAKVPRL